MEGIRSASGFIRGELARRVNLRNTPELTFLFDDSIAYGVAMSKKIDEVTEKDRLAKEQRGEEISE
jgi:ribosome-binding factor A